MHGNDKYHLFLDEKNDICKSSKQVLCTAAAYDGEFDNNATLWPHLARSDLLDFQLGWNFKKGPSVAIIHSLWPCPYDLVTKLYRRDGKSGRTQNPR